MNDFNKEPELGTEPLTADIPEQETTPLITESLPTNPSEAAAEAAVQEDVQTELLDTPEVIADTLPEIPTEVLDSTAEHPEPAPEAPAVNTAPIIPPQPEVNHPPYTPNVPPQNLPTPPQYGYPQPVSGAYPPAAPKRKIPLGLKILIIAMCVLFGVAIIGFVGYGVYSFVTGISQFNSRIEEYYSPDKFHVYPDEENGGKDTGEEPGDKNSGETEQNEIVIPDIDVIPNTDGIQLHSTPNTEELDITEVYDKVIRSTVLVLVTAETGTGSGTGIIATEDGYIITNSHVVLNSRNVQVQVKTNDGALHDAVVVGFDKTTDLAVLKIEGTGYTPAEFADSDDLRMGQWVIAIGNPGGEQFSGSITRGVVSGLDRSVGSYSSNGMTYIQTDAAINPGNSGGPLVNLYGQVVGINSAKIVSDEYEGMGFAIPVTGAKKIIDDLLSGGYVEGRVRFGITGTEVTEMQAYMSGVPQGFMIATIDEDSSFTDTDVQPYDIIIAIDDVETPTLDALSNALLVYSPGDTVTITLVRPNESGTGGEEFEVEATLLADLGETQK